MNPRWLSVGAGLACALSLFSPVAAVPIVQMNSSALVPVGVRHDVVGFSQNWFVNEFDPASGTLTSVRVDVAVTLLGITAEVNPFSFPLGWSPLMSVTFTPFLVFDGSSLLAPTSWSWVSGPSQILEPNQLSTFRAELSGTVTSTFTAPSDLALFYGTGTGQIALVGRFDGYSSYGAASFSEGIATATLTYNVPDDGSTLLLSLLAASLFIAWPQRKQLRPTSRVPPARPRAAAESDRHGPPRRAARNATTRPAAR